MSHFSSPQDLFFDLQIGFDCFLDTSVKLAMSAKEVICKVHFFKIGKLSLNFSSPHLKYLWPTWNLNSHGNILFWSWSVDINQQVCPQKIVKLNFWLCLLFQRLETWLHTEIFCLQVGQWYQNINKCAREKISWNKHGEFWSVISP